MNSLTIDPPPFTHAKLRVHSRGTLFEAPASDLKRQAAFFCELFRATDGTIYTVFQTGAIKHAVDSRLVIFCSTDEGATWRELPSRFSQTCQGVPISQANGMLAEQTGGTLLLFASLFDRSEPERPPFDPVTEGILNSFLVVSASSDGGETWSDWNVLETPGYTGCSLTGGSISLGNGGFGIAFESFKRFDEIGSWPHRACLMEFDGKSLRPKTTRVLATDPAGHLCYWDQRLSPGTRNREVLDCFWTHDRASKRDLSVHFLRADLDGKIPSPCPTGIKGQIAAPALLADGRILMLVVERESEIGTIQLHVSEDGGGSWQPGPVIYEHSEAAQLHARAGEDIDFAAYWEDMGKWSFGHPALLDLGNGSALCLYYAGTPKRFGIRWAKVSL